MIKKKLLVIGVLAMAGVVSCAKNNSNKGKVDCIDRYIPKSTDYTVSQSGIDSISRLFALNNLSEQNLQFIQWISDSLNPPGQINEQVTSVQYVNGLPIFQLNKTYFFKNAVQESYVTYPQNLSYEGYTGSLPNSDSGGHIPIADLREYFLSNVSESIYTNRGDNSYTIVPDSSEYTNACLQVILGYIDASVVPGNGSNINSVLIKVWRITPIGSKNNLYPVVYVTDDKSVAWGAEPLGPNVVKLFPNFY